MTRTGVVLLLAAAGGLAVLSTASGSPPRLSREALVPNAVAFSDSLHGELGTGWESCVNKAWHCRLHGTISATSDGGETWRVIRRTPRPVVAITFLRGVYYAELDNGRMVSGQPGSRNVFKGYCPKGWISGYSADPVGPNLATPWSICLQQSSAGNQTKAIYRGHTRVAYAPLSGPGGYGGITSGGYPQGIAGSDGGFGVVWETRGTLFVTSDGGRHWDPRPKLTGEGNDFGQWAYILSNRVGYAILSYGDIEKRRLIETTDAGRTWHVVHRWTCTAKRQRCGDITGPP